MSTKKKLKRNLPLVIGWVTTLVWSWAVMTFGPCLRMLFLGVEKCCLCHREMLFLLLSIANTL